MEIHKIIIVPTQGGYIAQVTALIRLDIILPGGATAPMMSTFITFQTLEELPGLIQTLKDEFKEGGQQIEDIKTELTALALQSTSTDNPAQA